MSVNGHFRAKHTHMGVFWWNIGNMVGYWKTNILLTMHVVCVCFKACCMSVTGLNSTWKMYGKTVHGNSILCYMTLRENSTFGAGRGNPHNIRGQMQNIYVVKNNDNDKTSYVSNSSFYRRHKQTNI